MHEEDCIFHKIGIPGQQEKYMEAFHVYVLSGIGDNSSCIDKFIQLQPRS
jgi:hypothetical protein